MHRHFRELTCGHNYLSSTQLSNEPVIKKDITYHYKDQRWIAVEKRSNTFEKAAEKTDKSTINESQSCQI